MSKRKADKLDSSDERVEKKAKEEDANARVKRLVAHLKPMSKNQTDDPWELFKEWRHVRMEDRKQPDGVCPCGQMGIRFECYIQNAWTSKETFVGTQCIEKFADDILQTITHLGQALLENGVLGTYQGLSKSGKTMLFQISALSGLVKQIESIREQYSLYFAFLPAKSKKKQRWTIWIHKLDPCPFVVQTKYRLYLRLQSEPSPHSPLPKLVASIVRFESAPQRKDDAKTSTSPEACDAKATA
jgi:hypothetical protein